MAKYDNMTTEDVVGLLEGIKAEASFIIMLMVTEIMKIMVFLITGTRLLAKPLLTSSKKYQAKAHGTATLGFSSMILNL